MRFVAGMQRMPAHREGLPQHGGRTKAPCHMGPSGGLSGSVGWNLDPGTQGTQLSFHLLHIFLTCTSSAWLFELLFFSPWRILIAFSSLEDLGFFKVYRNRNGISLTLVLMYPP